MVPVAAAPSSAILDGAIPTSRRLLASSSRARRLWCSSSRRHLSRHTSMPQLLLMADSLAQVDCSPYTSHYTIAPSQRDCSIYTHTTQPARPRKNAHSTPHTTQPARPRGTAHSTTRAKQSARTRTTAQNLIYKKLSPPRSNVGQTQRHRLPKGASQQHMLVCITRPSSSTPATT